MIVYSLIASIGFGVLYAGAAFAQGGGVAQIIVVGLAVLVLFTSGFLVPPLFFRYANDDDAPTVMSRVVARAGAGAAAVLVADLVTLLAIGRASVPLFEELYVYTLLALFLFHGFGGAIASHVVYLQRTKQYNSNQLVAVLVVVTLVLLILVLYFVSFDYAFPRDAYIHLRDLVAMTMVLLAYGRAIYLMAHH